MKCENCKKNMRKLAQPITYIENINTSEGLMKVTWEQRWKCPSCNNKVGVAVKCELIQPKPSITKEKTPAKNKEEGGR